MACAATVIFRPLGTALVVVLLTACSGGDAVEQPFPFDHAVHIKADVDCLQCHEGVLDPEERRLPTLATCASCHKDPPPAGNALLSRLSEIQKSGVEFQWDPTLRLADHVFFSHVRHVDVAELECAECHADMPKRTKPPTTRRTVAMNECIGCHEKHKDRPSAKRAITDCASCHR